MPQLFGSIHQDRTRQQVHNTAQLICDGRCSKVIDKAQSSAASNDNAWCEPSPVSMGSGHPLALLVPDCYEVTWSPQPICRNVEAEHR